MPIFEDSLSRRQMIRMGCGCGCAAIIPESATIAASKYVAGCSLTPEGIAAYRAGGRTLYSISSDPFSRNQHEQTTGDATIDRELDRAVKIVADTLGVNPAIGFYEPDKFLPNQRPGMGAFAFDFDDPSASGTRGVVAFGLISFRAELYGYDESGTTVMAIIAHEFGHILQFNRSYWAAIGVFLSEINADYLSGYYLGVRKRVVPSLPFEKALDLFIRIGQAGDGDPNRDHGDSRERPAAATAGFQVGYERASLEDAVRSGLKYVGY